MGIKENVFVLNAQHELAIYVFHRGGWCMWCRAYAKAIEKELVPQAERNNGKVFFVSSESEERAEETAKEWNISSEVLGDPSNEFAHMHHVPIANRNSSPAADNQNKVWVEEFPNGFCQPAVVAYYKEKPIFRWTQKPSASNFDGAKDMPVPADVWAVLKTIIQGKSLEGSSMGAFDSHALRKIEPHLYEQLRQYYQSRDKKKFDAFERPDPSPSIPADPCHLDESPAG